MNTRRPATEVRHRETPRYIALCVLGPDRAQHERFVDMRWSEGQRRLAPSDCAADLPPRWRKALVHLARGWSVGAVMHNKLYHAGLVHFALGGRHRTPRLTDYARGVVRALGHCPHDGEVRRGPDLLKTYRSFADERLGSEICALCGARRLVWPRTGRGEWCSESGWLKCLGLPETVRELPDHSHIGPYL